MDKQEYNEIIEALTDHRKGVSDSKREDYTKGSEDVLANFKSVAESTGVSPLKVWLVYANKHWDAICNYIKSEGQSESEPIKERFGDLLNYLELGWGLVNEKKYTATYRQSEVMKEMQEEYSNLKGKYRLPRKAKIIKEGTHGFDIGEVVTLTDIYNSTHIHNEHYRAKNEKGKVWYVDKDDIELVKNIDGELTRLNRRDGLKQSSRPPEYCQSPETCGKTRCSCGTGRTSGI